MRSPHSPYQQELAERELAVGQIQTQQNLFDVRIFFINYLLLFD